MELANLKSENENKAKEVDSMEKEWTNKQTVLVKKTTKKQEM